jgi:hypothetical protein
VSQRNPLQWVILFTVTWLAVQVAEACKYTVRDLGFVGIHEVDYAIVVTGPEIPSFAEDLTDRLRSSTLRLVVTLAGEVESNSAGDSGREPLAWSAEVADERDRRFLIGRAESAEELGHLIRQRLDAELFSGTLHALAANAADVFAHIVMVEGSEAAANAAARRAVDASLAALRRVEPMLPRPIALPVRHVVVPCAQRRDKPLLIWSMTDGAGTPDDPEPLVAVVYGAGRLAGPVLRGGAIDGDEIGAQLALIGESCECEMPRDWLRERSLPIPWGPTHRRQAADRLGFDPMSPLVRAEVVRIVSRGPSGRSAPDAVTRRNAIPLERRLLGYTESTLEPHAWLIHHEEHRDLPPPEPTLSATWVEEAASARGAWDGSDFASDPNSMNVTVLQGDGWEFDTLESPFSLSTEPALSAVEIEPPLEQRVSPGRNVGPIIMVLAIMLLCALLISARLVRDVSPKRDG